MEKQEINLTDSSMVTVTKMNHIVEVQHMEKSNYKANIKKLDKQRYVDLSTGEICNFSLSENRQQNINSLRQTFKKIRYLINNNFVGAKNELHITLTYKENMTDAKRLYNDFKRFMTRLKREFKSKTSIDYISVVEPQQRGAWHCHCLLRFNDLKSVYLSNKKCSELWEQGFVTIHSLKDIDNIGAYLSAYLSDVEVKEIDNLVEIERIEGQHKLDVIKKVVEGQEKRFVKGGRLYLYPVGMNIYRKSKGILEPVREKVSFSEAKKIVGFREPHYQKKYMIENEDFRNSITFIQYNLKR